MSVHPHLGAVRSRLRAVCDVLDFTSPPSSRLRTTVFTVGCALLAAASNPALGQVEGLRYSVSPGTEHVRWDAGLGLEDATLYGARLGFGFGRTLSLEGSYLQTDDVASSLSASDFPQPDPIFRAQDVDIRRYGADLVLNLSRSRTVPFLVAGGSVYKFDPAFGPSFEEIGVQFGGGVLYAFTPRIQGRLTLQNSLFRVDRFQLAPASGEVPAQVDAESDDVRNNLSIGLGLDFQLGGYDSRGETEVDRALRARYQAGLRGASWPTEPFIGSLHFHDSAGISDQDLIGVRTGVDLGTYLGLRGYYWRGMDGLDDIDPIQGYGGELQFLLNSGPGVRPYLIGGVGYVDFLDDFERSDGSRPDDETVLIAGGGLRFTVGQRFHVDLAARDYLFSDRGLGDVGSTSDLSDNWMYTAGLVFSFGGRGGDSAGPTPGVREREPIDRSAPPTPPAGVLSVPASTDEAAQDVDRVPDPATGIDAAVREPATGDASPSDPLLVGGAVGDTLSVAPGPSVGEAAQGPASGALLRKSFSSTRTVTLPVPVEGEIYVRYGNPGGVEIQSWFDGRSDASEGESIETYLRRLVREETGQTPEADGPSGSDAEDVGSALDPGAAEPSSGPEDPSRRTVPQVGAAPDSLDERSAMPTDPTGETVAATLLEELRQMELRLSNRIDERIERGLSADGDTMRTAPGAEADSASPTPTASEVDPEPSSGTTNVTVVSPGSNGRSLRGVAPFFGVATNRPRQAAVGARADLGPVWGKAPIDLFGELSVSLSDNTAYLAALHLRARPFGRGGVRQVVPYVYAGPGLLGFDEPESGFDRTNAVFDFGYGVERRFGRFLLFLEHQGVDAFDYNRILFGVSGFGR